MTTPLTGLTQAEALQRREQGQGNHAPLQTGRTYWHIIRENVFTFINNALFLLGLALVLLGRPMDALISVSVIMVNVVVSVVQEIRAKKTLDRIALLTRPTASILRDGQETKADPNEIVLGDLLRVSAGDQIVVDGTLVEGKMDVDESLLTGESDVIPKQPGDGVFSGSFCVNGTALFEAQKVGANSFANQLTAGARAYRRVLTPLQKQISLVIRLLLFLMIYLQLLLVANTALNQITLVDSVKMSVVIAGLVPNGLFLAIAVAYALGAVRIAGKGALVQQSNAMESLSNVNILCLDKTGTLTANHIIFESLHPLHDETAEGLRQTLGDYAASVSAGNRTNDAIAAGCPGRKLPVSNEVDFSSQRKWSGLTFSAPELQGTYLLGAPEMLAAVLDGGLEPLEETIQGASDKGLRVLLFVRSGQPSTLHDEQGQPCLPDHVQPLGLVFLSDELRHEAGATLEKFAKAGVRLKIISGDNPQTVAALARQAGLTRDMRLVSGLELNGLSPSELAKIAESGDVFGRISPQQKEAIVRSLRAQGFYVAMIGDGVNDVLSLKQANLGVAMQSGSQAARGVADIILLNDSFAALPVAVNEGQRIINGMQDILKLFLARVFVTGLLVLSVGIVGGFPFSPRHSSLLALLTVGIPTLALAAWARPGPPKKDLVRWLLRFTIPASLTISLFGLLVYIFSLGWRTSWNNVLPDSPELLAAQTALTIFTILCGLVLIPFVEPPTRFFTGGDRLSGDWRPTWMAIGIALFFAVMLANPSLSALFDLVALEWWEYLSLVGITLLWAIICRWTWRTRLMDRFFYTDLG